MTDSTATSPEPASPTTRTCPSAWLQRARGYLEGTVDGSQLALFRISYGLVVAWEMARLVREGAPAGRYVDTPLNFTYWPFDWVAPLSAGGMVALFVAMSFLGAMVAAGLFTRAAAFLLGVAMSYVFLLERSEYLNHWYLACILAFMLAVVPAGDVLSVDAFANRRRGGIEQPTPSMVPMWSLALLRFQLGIVYFYAGIAKIDPDWIAGKPLSTWLFNNSDIPVLGTAFRNPDTGVVLANVSMVFDLAIVPLMLWSRTRRFVYPTAIAFHLVNSRVFHIGMFPWLMLLATAVFFPADMPRRMWRDLVAGRRRVPTVAGGVIVGALAAAFPRRPEYASALIGFAVGAICAYNLAGGDSAEVAPTPREPGPRRHPLLVRLGTWCLLGWVVVQLLLPFRHLAVEGNASWTGEGHQFAWRMLLRSKQGTASFLVTNPETGQVRVVDPSSVLWGDQLSELATTPDMMIQFAHFLEETMADELGSDDLVVTVESAVSLNGREPTPLVKPDVDLTTVDRPWWPPADWIAPLPDD